MARKYCSVCSYPLSTCVCNAIKPVSLPLSVVVIQHHKEGLHAKNTLRLAKLISPSISIIDDRDHESIISLIQQATNDSVLLYPNKSSVSLEEMTEQKIKTNTSVKQLVLIDGTWKQAHGIWKRHELVEHFRSVHFSNSITQGYNIRVSKRGFQLSTIEALAYSLSVVSQIDVSPYHDILHSMQAFWPKK